MMNRKKLPIVLFAFVFSLTAFSQDFEIGKWREHLPYNSCIAVAEAENIIYCATKFSLFSYNKSDNSVTRFTKINGLSDIGIAAINYHKQYKAVVIAYSNANIDLLYSDGIINVSDIKRKSIPGNKIIHNIFIYDKYIYFSCGFGIVVFDMAKREIKDTYYIGTDGSQINVYDIAINKGKIYAATENGIYWANLSEPNLANYSVWKKIQTIPYPDETYNRIEYFNDKAYINLAKFQYQADTMFVFDDSGWNYFEKNNNQRKYDISTYLGKLVITNTTGVHIFDTLMNKDIIWTYVPESPDPRHSIIDKENNIWIADNKIGLVKIRNLWEFQKIKPNGPYSPKVFSISSQDEIVWVASGGTSPPWGNLWLVDGIYSFSNEKWTSINRENVPELDSVRDFMCVAINPQKPSQIFAGTWGLGIVEFNDGKFTKYYNKTNSSLLESLINPGWIGVAGMAFDKSNNLWVTNSSNNMALSVKKANGNWKSYSLSPFINEDVVGNLIIDRNNQKWIMLPRVNGIAVYNDNNTLDNSFDDKVKLIDAKAGNGNLPGSLVYSLAEDNDGEIWIGTDKGIAVIYSPENVFTGQNFDAQQILVEQDGTINPLLKSETITAIAVDGSNKKWIGTQRAGVFLMSEDGTKEIHHFTKENSPLFSNTISSIAINHNSGEVFFGTDEGIISFKGKATKGGEEHLNVYAYPNPVPSGYNGFIAIKGLVSNADFKITNIAGNLIYQGKAEGGQAVWNGKNFSGERAKTGVYMVFSSNENGSETLVTKILFVN